MTHQAAADLSRQHMGCPRFRWFVLEFFQSNGRAPTRNEMRAHVKLPPELWLEGTP